MKKIWILTVSLSSLYGHIAAADYYRYKDSSGQTVITSTLPAEAAHQGYQKVSSNGGVIETVPPEKSSAELAADVESQKQREEVERQAEIGRQQAQAQARKDEILLKSFSTSADIERAQHDKIASIEILEGIIKENMTGVQKQLEDAKTSAVNYQKTKAPIPENLKKTIAESEHQIQRNKEFLARKTLEKKEILTKYQGLLDRFKALQMEKDQAHMPSNPPVAPVKP